MNKVWPRLNHLAPEEGGGDPLTASVTLLGGDISPPPPFFWFFEDGEQRVSHNRHCTKRLFRLSPRSVHSVRDQQQQQGRRCCSGNHHQLWVTTPSHLRFSRHCCCFRESRARGDHQRSTYIASLLVVGLHLPHSVTSWVSSTQLAQWAL